MAGRKASGSGSALREAFQTQLWPLPVLGIVVAVALGIGLPMLDAALDGHVPAAVSTYLFGGGPDAARTVLSAISGSLITVTSLTFSLTVVTLQLASGQFSPRLLRTFTRDRFVHVTLMVFLGTFTYSLIVLRTVRSRDSGPGGAFVPEIAITVAVLATLASVVFLVLFLAHLARQIRVETILQRVADETIATIDRMLDRRGDRSRIDQVPSAPDRAHVLLVSATGFLASVDEEDLLEAAVDETAVVMVDGLPGGSMVAGTPLGTCWALDGGRLPGEVRQRLAKRVNDAIQVGPERTAAQDIAFGLRQLTDVADKALSPGINDPTTAVHALGHIAGVLGHALDFELGPRLLRDEQGRVRVVLHRPGFADLLDSAIAQPRRFGSTSPNVLLRIAQLLREVAWKAPDEPTREAVRDQVDRLRVTLSSGDLAKTEVSELRDALRLVDHALTGSW